MYYEKRAHERVSAACGFAININGVICRGKTRNVSLGGVLARVEQGDISKYADNDQGNCRISFADRSGNLPCRIIRVAGLDIAAQFLEVDFEQNLFLRTLIEHFS